MLVAPVISGALGSKLAGVPWTGFGPFLKALPSLAWSGLVWPVPVPWIILLGLLYMAWRSWRRRVKVEQLLEAKVKREQEELSFTFRTGDGLEWRFLASRGSPSPTIRALRPHCEKCGTPVIIYQPPGGPHSWMGTGSERDIYCPQGHMKIETSYSEIQRMEMAAQALAEVTAGDYFREQDAK